MRETFDKAKKR